MTMVLTLKGKPAQTRAKSLGVKNVSLEAKRKKKSRTGEVSLNPMGLCFQRVNRFISTARKRHLSGHNGIGMRSPEGVPLKSQEHWQLSETTVSRLIVHKPEQLGNTVNVNNTFNTTLFTVIYFIINPSNIMATTITMP